MRRDFNLLNEITRALEQGYDRNIDPQVLAYGICGIIDEAHARCRDRDCVRRWHHSYVDAHLWKHRIQPPVTWSLFGSRCFACGRTERHRIHSPRSA